MKWIGRAARWALLAVVFVICAALFYLIAVMGNGDDTHDARQSATLAPAAWPRLRKKPRRSCWDMGALRRDCTNR